VRDVLHDVLEQLDLVARLAEGVEAVVDLRLARGAHLVVRALDVEAEFVEEDADLVTQVGELVDRRDGEIAPLVGGLVAEVAALLDAARVPGGLDGVDVVVARVLLRLEADVVEDVELGLGSEERGVRDPGRPEVRLGLGGHLARVTAVGLVRVRVHDVEVDVEGLLGAERVDVGRVEVGHQLHVRLVDGLEATDRGSVEHLAVGEEVVSHRLRRDVEVLHHAGKVTEPDVDELHVLLGDEGENLICVFEHPSAPR